MVTATQEPPAPRAATRSSVSAWLLSVGVPILIIAIILIADVIESPKTAYVGVLTAVPLFAAIFGTPVMTAITGALTLLSAWLFGLTAADGNVTAQTIRLLMIAIAVAIAIGAAALRENRERQLLRAEEEAAYAERLRIQAMNDPLTGLLNRRGAIEALEAHAETPHVLAVVDCDDFKDVNDAYGHPIGDRYLQALAGRLRGSVSTGDIVARWGGDEFLLVIHGDEAPGRLVVDRVIAQASAQPIALDMMSIPVSLSFGVAPLISRGDLDRALTQADAELYQIKRNKRRE